MAERIDLTPTPRLLGVVGKIPLKGWQCIAELLDNSIDAMIQKQEDSKQKNEIRITLPSNSEMDNNVPLIVSDNGIGMTKSQLKDALTAGLSGKTSDSDLGLFGMGFNIATARVSKSTTVWTSVDDADEDIGVEINIPEMIQTRSFSRDLIVRKNSKTSPKGKHGTTIEIKDYTADAKSLLYRPDLIRNLNSVYSSVIKDKYNIDIKAKGNEGWVPVKPKRFCLWDKNRTVVHSKRGEIKPYISFDQKIKTHPYCTKCLIELHDINIEENPICPECNSGDSVIIKEYNVRGWAGIQRYFTHNEYGFDIVRNGRIIKEWDKSLFTWHRRSGQSLPGEYEDDFSMLEYPIDNAQLGGRIVGEIHADFIIPEFTKDNFSPTEDWLDVVEIVRGDRPIQPDWATKKLGLGGINKSPLAMLFYGFRKTTPGRQSLVCGVKNGGANAGNVQALEYKRNFYAGAEDFQTDEKWYELVLIAEEGSDPGGPGLPGPEDPDGKGKTPETEPEEKYPGIISPVTEKIFDLERLIDVPPITAKIYDYTPVGHIEFNPVIFEAESTNVYHVRLNQMHTMLRDFEEGWQDIVLMEIAQLFFSRIFDTDKWPISTIYFELKSKYYPERILNIDKIVAGANNLMRDLHNYLINQAVKLKPKPNLSPNLIDKMKSIYRDLENKNLKSPSTLLGDSGYVKYLDMNYLYEFIHYYPNLIFDEKFLTLPYKEYKEDPDHQAAVLRDHINQFSQLEWIIEVLSDLTDVQRKTQKSKIISAKLALQYLIEARV